MPFNYKTELQRYRRYYQSLEPVLKKSKSQNYTAVIFSFLVVSLFGLYAIRPTIQTILTLRREINDKTEVSKKMEEKITSLIEAQAAYSQIEESLPLIDQALPDSPDAIPLIIQIRNLAAMTGVHLSAFQLPPVPLVAPESTAVAKSKTSSDTNKQQGFHFTVSVVGPYPAIHAFLSGLLDMRRVISIDAMAITNDTASEQSASGSNSLIGKQLELTISLLSYYLVE